MQYFTPYNFIYAIFILYLHNKHAEMKERNNWSPQLKRYLKSEMIKRGISCEELQVKLSNKGFTYTKSSVETKICRGKFSAVFFVQCLWAMNCKSIDIKNIAELVQDNEN